MLRIAPTGHTQTWAASTDKKITRICGASDVRDQLFAIQSMSDRVLFTLLIDGVPEQTEKILHPV